MMVIIKWKYRFIYYDINKMYVVFGPSGNAILIFILYIAKINTTAKINIKY